MEPIAEVLAQITVGEVILASLAACVLYEAAIHLLPARLTGPGGWLIDTSRRRG